MIEQRIVPVSTRRPAGAARRVAARLVRATQGPLLQPVFRARARTEVRRGCVILALLTGLLTMPSAACGHGVLHQVTQRETALLKAEYDDGEPMSYAEVKVYSPRDGKAAHQTGRTDRNGCFAFVPDCPGQWRILLDGGMGHLSEATFVVSESLAVEMDRQAGRAFSRWPGVVVGLGVIFGLSGFLFGLRMRRERRRTP